MGNKSEPSRSKSVEAPGSDRPVDISEARAANKWERILQTGVPRSAPESTRRNPCIGRSESKAELFGGARRDVGSGDLAGSKPGENPEGTRLGHEPRRTRPANESGGNPLAIRGPRGWGGRTPQPVVVSAAFFALSFGLPFALGLPLAFGAPVTGSSVGPSAEVPSCCSMRRSSARERR